MAQSVEHVIGNDEVIGSIPITSSKNLPELVREGFYFFTLHSSLFTFHYLLKARLELFYRLR